MLWPDEIWPQGNGALAVLYGSSLLDPDGRFRIEAMREMIAARLHLVPRFWQLSTPRRSTSLTTCGLFLSRPPATRMRYCSPPSSSAAAWTGHGRCGGWFLPGLPDRRAGMFVKVHHAIAAVATTAAFLDATPDATQAPPRRWTPAPPPGPRDLLADNLRSHAGELGRAFSAIAEPLTTARPTGDLRRCLIINRAARPRRQVAPSSPPPERAPPTTA